MSALGLAACGPYKQGINISSSCCLPASRPCFLPIYANRTTRSFPGLVFNASSYRRSMPVCLFGGKGNPGEDSEGSPWFPWKALEKGWNGLTKRQSMEDILKEQIRKGQFAGEGGGTGIPPGGRDDGFGGSEDESSDGVLDEFIQVILATIGLIFLYVYIIDGEELTRLAGDFIKYLFSRKQSNRLKQTMYMWSRFFQRLTRKVEEVDRYWLEREILNTPTWWYNPREFRNYLRSRLASLSSSSSSSPSSSSYYE
ncbi:uncharacterized protein LOC122088902 [Macadamia integrifolia]|uniref:uncharacterized protein LOC122088902 n=1 Tax=Macadamia integrifolia TaxID=60698 RepID=UPI001C4F34A6|nr:uncharacterized protein LOC122088902 [Macadamia integrifolia]XP_042514201.1 uncharacterized protein LOC122088902 [Macadamia integrifolia]